MSDELRSQAHEAARRAENRWKVSPSTAAPDGRCLADFIADAVLKVVRPEIDKPQPGVMHEVDEAFYRLTVKERDYERARGDRLQMQFDMLAKRLAELKAERDDLARRLAVVEAENTTLRGIDKRQRDGWHARWQIGKWTRMGSSVYADDVQSEPMTADEVAYFTNRTEADNG